MQQCDKTVVTREYPQKYEPGREAFYPLRDQENLFRYEEYRQLAAQTGVVFGGRLGSYQYYDMHQVIAQAMMMAEEQLQLKPGPDVLAA
jgi:UDP-galactopyranose mutase